MCLSSLRPGPDRARPADPVAAQFGAVADAVLAFTDALEAAGCPAPEVGEVYGRILGPAKRALVEHRNRKEVRNG